jgi:catechol 2,3-dioxygenase-like lactoylglutathione lyase family enzyme
MPSLLKGIDHIYLSVTDFDRSEAFYDRMMETLGLHKGDKAIAGERHAHYLAPTFQLSLRPARSERAHDAYAAGLHHLCFQAESRAAVDEAYQRLSALGIAATAPATYPEYNPEYYATFFEDPDGFRLEIVARTSYRQALVDRWDEFDRFLNPLAALPPRST